MRSRAPLLLLCLSACTSSTAPSPGGADSAAAGAPAPPASVAASTIAASVPAGSALGMPVRVPEALDPHTPARSVREATLRNSEAFATVRSLVDEASPRLSGSPGFTAAVGWGKRTLAAAGLVNVHTERVKVPHWERGAESGEIVAPYAHKLAIAALGGSVGTSPAGLEAEVILVESLEAVDKLDPSIVKGKIVFYDVPMERSHEGSGYGKAVGVRGVGAINAAKLGAVGVVIRSIGTDDNRLPHTGAMRYDDKVPKIPAAAISVPDAEMLHRIVVQATPVRLRMTLGAKSFPDADGANVMGELLGSAAPDEIVLLGAHLDSWDLGHGALDDGAGCAIIIEAARQIGKLGKPPRRTIRVVLFANEENGLAGAKAYEKAHAPERDKHVLALESDFGAGRVWQTRFLGPDDKRADFLKIAAVVRPLGAEPSEEPAEGGADLSPLLPWGVPFIDLRQDGTLYFDIHHTANDTLDQIKKEDLDQVAAAYAATAYAAADAPGDLGRVPEDKRKRNK